MPVLPVMVTLVIVLPVMVTFVILLLLPWGAHEHERAITLSALVTAACPRAVDEPTLVRVTALRVAAVQSP